MTDPLKELLVKANKFAKKKHIGQMFKNGKPHILHCNAVSAMQEDTTLQIVGVLHDIMKTRDVSFDELVSEFGDRIAYYVLKLTHNKFEETYEEYLKTLPEYLHPVKIADIVQIINSNSSPKQRKNYYKALVILNNKKKAKK